jgi:REP element-mobilizing transposase RayT
MPRMARQKTYDAIFHVMCKSITEVDLFKDDIDKLEYVRLIKEYQKVFKFKVYGYCLMSNHVHLLIDVNGADISMIMHGINYSYAGYFNRTHHREGHLFKDRFKSKMVNKEVYLYALSAYIHNNPTKIKGYEKNPEKYPFSSLSVYLGLNQDPHELVNDSFVLSMFGNNQKTARRNYMKLVFKSDYKWIREDAEFTNEGTEYRSQRKILARDTDPEKIIEFLVSKLNVSHIKVHAKNGRGEELVETKALLAMLMRGFCNAKCADICKVLGSISQSRASTLCSYGLELMDKEKYREIAEEFLKEKAT